MNKWNVIHECDLEDGTPTEWAIQMSKGKFFWIDLLSDGSFDVIDSDAHTILKNCKSLSSAERWVTMNLL